MWDRPLRDHEIKVLRKSKVLKQSHKPYSSEHFNHKGNRSHLQNKNRKVQAKGEKRNHSWTLQLFCYFFVQCLNHYCASFCNSAKEGAFCTNNDDTNALPSSWTLKLTESVGMEEGGVGLWVTDWCLQDGGSDKSTSETLWAFVEKRLEREKG